MRTWIIREWGLLAIQRRDERMPGPGELLLRMKAVSVNYRDLLMLRGQYNPRQPLPLIPCSDGVGEVVAVGPGVERFTVGERVVSTFFQDWIAGPPTPERVASTLGGPLDGVLAEMVTLGVDGVVRVPQHLTDHAAAALPCAGLTAWNALVHHGHLRAGQTVAILGTGGVATFCVQFARMLGARVVVLSSSDEKLAYVQKLGADAVINYLAQPNWGKAIAEMTQGRGVDVVVELGGGGSLEQSLRAVAVGGTIVLIGVLAGAQAALNITPAIMRQVRIQGMLVGHRDSFEEMNRAIELHQLEPVIDQVFSFNEAPMAFEHLQHRQHVGKVAIRF